MRICCIGDSNTYGYDPALPMGGRYHYEVRWEGRLEAAGHSVVNHGYNGLPVMRRSLHAMFARQVEKEGPFDLVTIMLGSNDIILGSSPQETAADMEALIMTLKETLGEGSQTNILLIAPPPFVPGFWVEGEEQIRRSKALAGEYRALAERQHILFADAGQWGIPLAFDGVHFTEEGHRIFAEKLNEKILRCAQDDRE
ncbi:MAG: hypothetical protein IJK77_08870 [Lachnospiraceae bacterium]|nr:hypothetical protein [Lachnospiraceae bacterium]